MLDPNLLRTEPNASPKNWHAGALKLDVDKLRALEERRKGLQFKLKTCRRAQLPIEIHCGESARGRCEPYAWK